MTESTSEPADLLLPGAPDVRAAAIAWLDGLASERRLSPNTVEAYRRDLRQFLAHFVRQGANPDIPALIRLKPRDVRAFMAMRRQEGVGGRSLMRALAGLRSFARHLDREGHGSVAALAAVRSPKVERRLPRPLPSPPRWRWRAPTSGPATSVRPGCWPGTPPCWRSSTARACASRRLSA